MTLEHMNRETRVEHATVGGKRNPIRRMVKLPGASQHAGNDENAELIAKRIQLAKMERRVKRNG
ncbi:MAG: hypothetical protein EOR43_23090 [Mesorhizobium sp.]|uniref:hypothetical protein n=1 Tax=Mesorhizobium sp. TaxID=1871066 RepID=UPI000FE3C954|nr:hypothetical protein [Mesorhizobium sp.]RWK19812.1 MAG: hypothetical protein EOR43_23090 [Mesorhizobium sp.]RWK28817.1 MAG: hypothetical protein EOR44_21990 [Mesorhizobium sp.]